MNFFKLVKPYLWIASGSLIVATVVIFFWHQSERQKALAIKSEVTKKLKEVEKETADLKKWISEKSDTSTYTDEDLADVEESLRLADESLAQKDKEIKDLKDQIATLN